jgi:hypothetical protein
MLISDNKLPHIVSILKSKTNFLPDERLSWYLYIIDIEVYRRLGRTATGLSYFAYDRGPAAVLGHTNTFPEIKEYDTGLLTRFELKTIDSIKDIFDESIKCFHGNSFSRKYIVNPWIKTLDSGKGYGRIIPFRLSLDKDSISIDHADEIETESKNSSNLFKTTVNTLMMYTKFSNSPIYWENKFLEKMRMIVDDNLNVVTQFFNNSSWVNVQLKLSDLECAAYFE